MAQITINIPDEYATTEYATPQYVVLVTAETRWGRPEFAALLIKENGEDEEIGEDTSIKGLLSYAASVIYKESR